MTTAFDVLVAMAQRLPGTVRGVATGGAYVTSATNLIDTNQLTVYANDAWNGGTLLIETGVLAGAVLIVSDSVQSTGTLVLSDLLWDTVTNDIPVAGVRYTLINSAWPAGVLLAAVEEALRQWGTVETEVTLGTGDGTTTRFVLPTGTTGQIVQVFLINEDSDFRLQVVAWETDGDGVDFEIAPSSGWVVTAIVVGWPTLTDNPDYDEAQGLEYLTTAGTGGLALWGDGGFGYVYAGAQTFTLAKRTKITALKYYIDNDDVPSHTLTIHVWGTFGGGVKAGLPDWRDVLYTGTGTALGATAGWVTTTLSETLVLDSGIYALIVQPDATKLEPSITWNFGLAATYADGKAYKVWLDGSAVGAAASDDFRFEVDGQEEIPRAGAEVWPDDVPVEFGAWYGAYTLMRGRVGVPGHDQEGMVQLMNYALERAEGERGRSGWAGVRNRERMFRG